MRQDIFGLTVHLESIDCLRHTAFKIEPLLDSRQSVVSQIMKHYSDYGATGIITVGSIDRQIFHIL